MSLDGSGTEAGAQVPVPKPLAYQRVRVIRTHKGCHARWERLDELKLGKDCSGGAQAAAVFVCPSRV
eukprot:CAMPEP_0115139336 /NCGR_PEP_ID=MMETSP0227-20121206/58230_1 /TAXON_ID=89957 /ORGANISM="Polarella glacialis, Strain CCMP 1383" /LENGTH=66 /DNA_ID=CAMNT_0002547185 /DNA_START=77 /DNA_END=273 /DNA_ORIENTATION=-